MTWPAAWMNGRSARRSGDSFAAQRPPVNRRPRHSDFGPTPRQPDCRQLDRKPRPTPLSGRSRTPGGLLDPCGKSPRSDKPLLLKASEGRKAQCHPHAFGQQPGAYGLGRDSACDSLSQHHRPNKCRPAANGTRRRRRLLQQPSRRSGIRGYRSLRSRNLPPP